MLMSPLVLPAGVAGQAGWEGWLAAVSKTGVD